VLDPWVMWINDALWNMDGLAPRLIQLDLGAAATSADEELWPGDPAGALGRAGEMGDSGSTISPQCPRQV
jgi:hypothetical protein